MSKRIWLILTLIILLAVSLIWFSKSPNASLANLKRAGLGEGSLEDYYRASLEIKPLEAPEVTFLAGGDIMLSRNVASKIKKANDPNLPFSKLQSLLSSTDFNFANLETPITTSTNVGGTGSLVFNTPESLASGLKQNNFQILNLANNHAYDQGLSGLLSTRKYLEEQGIKFIGAGANLEEAWKPEIISKNNLKIAFIGASYSSVNDGGKSTNSNVARIEDLENLKKSIGLAKTQSDFIVVTMHAGTEYTRGPNASQSTFAHAAIDAGADLVIGAHPHWVQTIENYQGKYIFYSLGNFIFDQEWSKETKQGLALKITVNKTGASNELQGTPVKAELKRIEMIPIILENYSTPRIANDAETKEILNAIKQQSTVLFDKGI